MKLNQMADDKAYINLPDDAGELLGAYFGNRFMINGKDKEENIMASIRENNQLMFKEEREEGMEIGIKDMIEENIDENVPKERIITKLMKYFELSRKDAGKYFKKYAKQPA